MALTKIKGAGINISATEKLYFDGGGTTYIQESADGVLDFYADNVKMLELLEGATDYVWIPVDATKFAIGAGKDLNIYTSSDDAIIENITSDKDIIFKGNDGGSTITALTLDISAAGAATFNDKIIATELDISGNIDIDGTTNLDVVDIDGAVDMASTLGVTGVVTANAGVVVDNITIDGTEIDLSSGNLTLDVAGSIILNADGGQIQFHDAGTEIGVFENSSSDFVMESKVQDKDIIFKGNDGGSGVTALTLDMSEGGNATFAGTVFVPEYIKHDGDTDTSIRFLSDNVVVYAGNENMIDVSSSAVVINEGGGDNDFRVETTGNTHAFFIDAGNCLVNINAPLSSQTQSTPQEVLALKTFYTGSADGAAGAGSLLSFYIPDDETNPAKGGGVACVKESADDSDMSSSLTFYTSGNDESISEKVRINSSGYVGIGGDPSVALHIKGHDPHFRIEDTTGTTEYWNISVGQAADGRLQIDDSDNDNGVYMNQNDTSWTSGSDERLKTNWTLFDNALSSINSLTKVGTFQYTKSIEDQTPKNDVVHSGLSAQEVQKFLPSSVSEDNNGILGLQYQHLIPMLVKAVQELSAKVEELEGN